MERDNQTDKQTERQTDRQTEGQTQRQTETRHDRETDSETTYASAGNLWELLGSLKEPSWKHLGTLGKPVGNIWGKPWAAAWKTL